MNEVEGLEFNQTVQLIFFVSVLSQLINTCSMYCLNY